jgi:hypothetical protein
MDKRYYLLTVFDDARSDRLQPFGEDIGAAVSAVTEMRQSGGPDGISAALVVTSTGRVVKYARVYSKAWHQNQTKAVLEVQDSEQREREQAQRDLLAQRSQIDAALAESGYVPPGPPEPPTPTPESILESLEVLKAQALELGVELPLQAPQGQQEAASGASGDQSGAGNPGGQEGAQEGAGDGAPLLDLGGPADASAPGAGAPVLRNIPSPVPPRASKGR